MNGLESIPQEFYQEWAPQTPLMMLEDGDRRTFEGWAAVDEVDLDGMLLPAEYMEWSLEQYMRTNPVLLWNHNPNLPIGRILKMRYVQNKGVYVKGEIAKARDIESSFVEIRDHDGEELLDVAKACEQSWRLIKSGLARSLSIGATNIGKQWEERIVDGVTVQVPKRIRIKEVSLAAIAKNPETIITAANILAKALPSISTGEQKIMDKLVELGIEIKELAEKNGGKLTQDQEEFAIDLLKALGHEKPEVEPLKDEKATMKSLQEMLEKQNQVISELKKSLEAVSQNEVAEPSLSTQKSTTSTIDGAQSVRKPTHNVDNAYVLKKALEISGKPHLAQTLGLSIPAHKPKFQNDMTEIQLWANGKINDKEVNVSQFDRDTKQHILSVHNLVQQGKL